MKGRPPLRDRVRVERRAERIASDGQTWNELDARWLEEVDDFDPSDDLPGDGAGNMLDNFVRIGPPDIRCDVRELEGGEVVQAGKLQGTSTCVVMLRVSGFVKMLGTDDRFIQLMPGGGERVLNIKHAPPPGRSEYRSFLCEDGVAT